MEARTAWASTQYISAPPPPKQHRICGCFVNCAVSDDKLSSLSVSVPVLVGENDLPSSFTAQAIPNIFYIFLSSTSE